MLLSISTVPLCAELALAPSDGTAAEFIAMRSGFGTLQTIAGNGLTTGGGHGFATTLELSTTSVTEFYRVSETKQ